MPWDGAAEPGRTPEPRPDLWQTWSGARMLAFAAFLLVTNFVAQGLLFLAADNAFVAVIGGALLGVALPAWQVSREMGAGVARDFDARLPATGQLAAAALLAIGALVPSSLLAGLSERISPIDEEWLRQFIQDLPKTPWETALAFGAVIVAAPLAEELVFRGILYRWARRMWGPVAGGVISALCFGLVHFEPWYFFGLVALGLVFAFVYETTRSLIACWLAHGLHNGCSLLLILGDRENLGAPSPVLGLSDAQLVGFSLAGMVAGAAYLLRHRRAWP